MGQTFKLLEIFISNFLELKITNFNSSRELHCTAQSQTGTDPVQIFELCQLGCGRGRV